MRVKREGVSYSLYYRLSVKAVVRVHDHLCTYQWHPPLPHPRVGWGNSGDLTEYHVKNPSPGALPDVNTPIYRQESIGDLT